MIILPKVIRRPLPWLPWMERHKSPISSGIFFRIPLIFSLFKGWQHQHYCTIGVWQIQISTQQDQENLQTVFSAEKILLKKWKTKNYLKWMMCFGLDSSSLGLIGLGSQSGGSITTSKLFRKKRPQLYSHTMHNMMLLPSKNFHFTRSKNTSALDLWVEPVCFLKFASHSIFQRQPYGFVIYLRTFFQE